MTAAVHLAGPDNLAAVLSLMARSHAERGLSDDPEVHQAIAAPLLDGSPLGAIWTVGPVRAPLGYVMVTFGWSLPHAGMIGWLSDIYVRPSVRRRGIGTEVLHAVALSLRQAGVKAIQAEMGAEAEAKPFLQRAGFDSTRDTTILTDTL